MNKEPIRLSTWIIVCIAIIFILGYLCYQSETFAAILSTIIILLVVVVIVAVIYRAMRRDYERYRIEEEKLMSKKNMRKENKNIKSSSEIECPYCGSTNFYADKRGYSAGGACLGAILFGPLGLLCGQSGANKIKKTCLSCNKDFR